MAAKYSNRYQVTAYIEQDVYDKLERLRLKTARSCFVEKLLKSALKMDNWNKFPSKKGQKMNVPKAANQQIYKNFRTDNLSYVL